VFQFGSFVRISSPVGSSGGGGRCGGSGGCGCGCGGGDISRRFNAGIRWRHWWGKTVAVVVVVVVVVIITKFTFKGDLNRRIRPTWVILGNITAVHRNATMKTHILTGSKLQAMNNSTMIGKPQHVQKIGSVACGTRHPDKTIQCSDIQMSVIAPTF